jgi:hypothetical protein
MLDQTVNLSMLDATDSLNEGILGLREGSEQIIKDPINDVFDD